MIERVTLMKILLLMVEFTSILLIVLGSIYLLSGYQLLNPELRIIPEPRRIHSDRFLRLLTITLTYLHALGGIMIMIKRRLRRGVLRKAVEITTIVVLTALLFILFIIEAMVSGTGYQYRWGHRT